MGIGGDFPFSFLYVLLFVITKIKNKLEEIGGDLKFVRFASISQISLTRLKHNFLLVILACKDGNKFASFMHPLDGKITHLK